MSTDFRILPFAALAKGWMDRMDDWQAKAAAAKTSQERWHFLGLYNVLEVALTDVRDAVEQWVEDGVSIDAVEMTLALRKVCLQTGQDNCPLCGACGLQDTLHDDIGKPTFE